MTGKAQHKKTRKRPRLAVQSTAALTGSFRMVVAANPGPSINVAPELELVKAALLYGDKVTLISPLTTMLLRVEGLQRFGPRQQLELMRRVVPVLAPDQVAAFERGIPEINRLLRPAVTPGRLGDQFLREAVLQGLAPYLHLLSEAAERLAAGAGIDQLARARREGLVEIERADPGDEIDLLASCLISAKLHQSGQRQENPHSHRLIETFVDRLSKHLSSGKKYLIFDRPIADLTEAAIREGIFTPAKGPTGFCAQAMTASGLMGRLPTFPTATVDEVLDIRSELAPSLNRFRSAMVTTAKTFTSQPWQADFEDEVQNAWVETVHPALEQIETSVRDNRSILNLAAGVSATTTAAWSGLMVVAAGLGHHGDVLEALGGAGALAVAAPLLKALRDRTDANRTVRMQPFYFLYDVNRSLG
jgi:hypothetical protein